MPIDPAIFQFGQRNPAQFYPRGHGETGTTGPEGDGNTGDDGGDQGGLSGPDWGGPDWPTDDQVDTTHPVTDTGDMPEGWTGETPGWIAPTPGEGISKTAPIDTGGGFGGGGRPDPLADDPVGQAAMAEIGQVWDPELGEYVDIPLTTVEQAQEDSAMRDMGYVWDPELNDGAGDWVYQPEEEGIPELTEEEVSDFETIEENAITALEEGVQENVGDFWEREMARLAARGVMGPGTEESSITQRTIADVAEGSAEAIAGGTANIQSSVAGSRLDYRMGAAGIDVARQQAQTTANQGWANIMQQGELGRMQTVGNIWSMQQATQQAEADRAQLWAIAQASNTSAETIANINANAQTSAAEEANSFSWTDLIPTFGFSF